MSGHKKSPGLVRSIRLSIVLAIWQIVLVVGLFVDYYIVGLGLKLPLLLIIAGVSSWEVILLISIIRRRKLEAKSKPKMSPGDILKETSIILNSLGEGVIAINKENLVTFINSEAQRLLGWTESESLGVDYRTTLKLVNVHDSPIDDSNNPIALGLSSQKQQATRGLLLKTMSDKSIPISLLVNPLGDGSESVIVTFRNISLELEEEREQREFISTASHEMRTPVAAIEGYLGLVLNPKICKIDEKAHEYISKAQEASKHLGELFRNLLNISRAEDGRMLTKMEVIELNKFVDKICDNFLGEAKSKGIEIKYAPTSSNGAARINPSIYVQADRSLLREAISNLLENAIKYTPQGKIEVEITIDSNNNAIIRVTDSGIGIPAEDISHLFQKFYRVDNSQTREINGTGLGLYLTRRIVEALHGRIWVESELGKGSSFYISLARLGNQEAKRIMEAEQVVPDAEPASTNIFDPQPKRESYQVPAGRQVTPMSHYTAKSEEAKPSPPQTAPSAADSATSASNYQPASSRTISASVASKLQSMGYSPEGFQVVPDDQAPTDPLTTNNGEKT